MTIKLGVDIYMDVPSVLRFGDDKVGSSHIPANTVIRLTYFNTTGGQKNLITYGEYLY